MVQHEDSKRIAIVGCGYVGSALAKALVEKGHVVVGTTTSAQRRAALGALGIEPVVVEVDEVDRLRGALADCTVVYLTIAPRHRGEPYTEVYVKGVERLLAAVAGTAVERIIYTSSTRVYGQDTGEWVDETSPTEPGDEKGGILLQAEQRLLSGAEALGLGATVLRLCGIYGPGRDVSAHISRYAGVERHDGEKYVNLIHLEDITAALCRLVDVAYHGVLNLADDRPLKRRDYFNRLLAKAGMPPVQWTASADTGLGKRIRNDLVKRTLSLALRHPTH